MLADKRHLRRFLEKFIPGTGRAKHPGNDLLVNSRLVCWMLSAKHTLRERPYRGNIFLGNLLINKNPGKPSVL